MRSFLHVNVEVEDVDAARAFYRGPLGLAEIERDGGARRGGAWFALAPAVELHLSLVPGCAAGNRASSRHFALEVADLAAVGAALGRAGAPLEPARPQPGRDRLFCRDPSGNRIELQQISYPQ